MTILNELGGKFQLKFLLLIVLTINSSSCNYKIESIEGKVIAIKDGDTIEVLDVNKRKFKIRLFGIDCPEKNQAFGQKAKSFTSKNCMGRDVIIKVRWKDRYGRVLGEVILPNGNNLNYELVKQGLAWHYRKYSSNTYLDKLESEAQKLKLGLWTDASAVSPWEFRKSRHSINK